MNSENRKDNDEIVQALIAEFLDADNRGQPLDRQELLSRHPDCAESLRAFFAGHDRMVSATEIDPPTLPPAQVASEDDTIAPRSVSSDDRTLPPSPSNGSPPNSETTAGDSVRYFGDYELLEEIARGGMGVVFKARQVNLNRIVALKMILAGQFAGEEDVQRFYTEAEAAASLDHPGIVPIFEIGEHAGQHYFSMGYIEGESLAQRIADGPLPPREAAELVEKICAAMAYAHDRGVIHRDLKPANVLIDSSGQPKVTDFGLAKKSGADSNLTGTGQILGTPAYMPPEQAAGKVDEVGPLADVYSLGAILYCLLSGRPPFQSASPMDTLLQVLEQQPLAPRTLNPQVPQDLNTICLKCLEKDHRLRYDSALDLGNDLGRYLNDEPITARPPSLVRLVRHWLSENVGAIGWAAVIGTLLGLLFSWNTLQTDIATFLGGIGNNLDRLQYPRELHPALTHLPSTPLWLRGIQQFLMVVVLVTAGLLVAVFVRPKNRPADVIAGSLAGFCAAAVLFLFCFSWTFSYREMAAASQDLLEVARAKSGEDISAKLMNRYPGLAAAESDTRVSVARNLVQYRQITSAAVGVFKAAFLSCLICIPSCLLETMLAGWLLRRHQTVRAALVPYLEIGLPVAMIAAICIMMQLSVLLGFVKTSVPMGVSFALYVPLIAATVAAIKRARWPLRVFLHLAWVASIAAVMAGEISQANSTNREQPLLGVAATDHSDRCEIRSVVPNSPASRAGLQQGDTIKALDGIEISRFGKVREYVGSKSVGDVVIVTIVRDGQETNVDVKLGRRNH